MRALAIAREAWRNILSGTTRTLTFALVLGAVTVTLLCADQFAIRQIVDDANHFRASGASTLTLAAERKIDGAACESLNSLDGVTAAGAMRNVEPGIRASALPSSPIALTEVTAGFPRILTNEPVPGAGAILSSEAADTLGLSRGDTLETTHGATTVAGTFEYPDDGRRRGLGYAALVVTSSDEVFDECWVDAWPTMPNLAAVLLTTLTPSGPTDETKPVLGQLNASLGTDFDGGKRLNDRISRFAVPATFAASVAIGLLAIRLRRMELASSLHSGVRRSDLAAMVGIETMSWVVPALCACTAAAAVFGATGNPEDATTTLVSGLRIPFAALAGATAGTAAALALTREKHLFRYFKDR